MILTRVAAALFMLLVGCGVAQAQPQAPAAFVERFETIDPEKWIVADGWTNGEWTANDWRRSQVGLTSNGLMITLARSRGGEKRFSSGELQSQNIFRYGYFEIRMRPPRGSGLTTGFFTYSRPGAPNTWSEIDIEVIGRDTRHVQLSYFQRGEDTVTVLPLGFDAAAAEHNYAFEWTAQAIRWYVDGRLIHEETGARRPIPQAAQRLYLHLWNTEMLTDWLGPILPWEGPWRLHVSCIAYAPQYEGRQLCAPQPK